MGKGMDRRGKSPVAQNPQFISVPYKKIKKTIDLIVNNIKQNLNVKDINPKKKENMKASFIKG